MKPLTILIDNARWIYGIKKTTPFPIVSGANGVASANGNSETFLSNLATRARLRSNVFKTITKR